MEKIEWTWKSSDGLDMYSRGWTPRGEPKAIVCLVHGLGEHTDRYAHVGAALTGKGYGLLGFDLRGHGRSGGPRGHTPSPEAFLDDIDGFLQEVERRYPGQRCFLYGHSLGGILVLAYPLLRKSRIAGVIATGSAMRSALEKDKVKLTLVKLLGPLLPSLTVPSGLDPQTLSHDPRVVETYVNDPLVHDRTTLGFGMAGLKLIEQIYQNASRFPVPVLIMHGAEDALGFPVGSQEVAALIPAELVTLRLWDGMYHEIHNEPEQAEVFKVMLDWLDKH